MSITQDDIAELVALIDQERDQWIHGVPPEVAELFQQDDDMTILGPWGGPGVRGRGPLGPQQAQMVSQFNGGSGTFELIKTSVEGDLAVVVGIERSVVMFEGRDEPRPWVLRSTQVFRKGTDTWVRLHRHADPLITRRSVTDTIALLPDG